jgi:hypothetical protein
MAAAEWQRSFDVFLKRLIVSNISTGEKKCAVRWRAHQHNI